ncbi:MAG TPA: tetratricopeptide repeat protein [Candidatus Sulfotelmatobacter sp.]|nr:tetratricopeptide repeat protein [Candidatus Sulfotelmatobacter sp.]
MKTIASLAALACIFSIPVARAQTSAPSQPAAAGQSSAAVQSSQGNAANNSTHGDPYYYFTLGHMQEQQYEASGRAELATQSIDSYKKALAQAPDSSVIMERLAEIYAKSQRTHDALVESHEVLKIDPDNVNAHRLLARIYVRTLSDSGAGEAQKENLGKAVEQFQAILKIQPDDTYSALWLARLYRFENKHDEAEKVLRATVNRDPSNSAALEQLSQLLVDEGRSQEAITLLTQAAGDSASPDVYDLLGDAYAQSKDYAKSEDAYRKAVAEDPDDPTHVHGLAQALMSQEKFAEALEQYKRLSELEPGTWENYLRMSELYRRLGQYNEGESALLRAKQLSPGNLEVLYNEALLYEEQGRYDDAVKILNEAISGVKNQTAATGTPGGAGAEGSNVSALAILYEQLGHAYMAQENYPGAIRTFEEMGKLGPEVQKRAEMLLIDAYRQSRDLDRAIAEAKKGLETSPRDQGLTVTLAMLYGEKSETEAATKLLNGLLQGNDGDQGIYVDIAQVQERGRKYADAEQSAQKAEQMAHDNGDKETTWFMLGAIYEREKKFDQAEEQFRKVLAVNPNNAAVLNYYGYMLADRSVRLEEATAMIQKAVTLDPNNGAYLDSLGWAYYKQNKLAEAEENLRKAADRQSHDPTILGHLGDVYMKLGQTARAIGLWERALAEWQKAIPADYEAEKVNDLDAQLKNLKRHTAQKSNPETAKPQ